MPPAPVTARMAVVAIVSSAVAATLVATLLVVLQLDCWSGPVLIGVQALSCAVVIGLE